MGRLAAVLALTVALPACGLFGPADNPRTTVGPVPSPTGAAGTAPAETSDFVATSSPVGGASPAPGGTASDDLGPFSCSLPIRGAATTDRAQIVDVRVGSHGGYDRVVFQFDSGTPDYLIEAASPPFVEDPSGRPLTVNGSAHLRVTLPGGTRQSATGTSTYNGPTSFAPAFEQLVELEEAGDFEATATWLIGRNGADCVRVLTLSGPDRLVIDLEHP